MKREIGRINVKTKIVNGNHNSRDFTARHPIGVKRLFQSSNRIEAIITMSSLPQYSSLNISTERDSDKILFNEILCVGIMLFDQ